MILAFFVLLNGVLSFNAQHALDLHNLFSGYLVLTYSFSTNVSSSYSFNLKPTLQKTKVDAGIYGIIGLNTYSGSGSSREFKETKRNIIKK